MMQDFVFVDKTLFFATEERKMNEEGYISLLQKISQMQNVIFDIPFHQALCLRNVQSIDRDKIRVCIDMDSRQVSEAYKVGYTSVKAAFDSPSLKEAALLGESVMREAQRLDVQLSVGYIDISRYTSDDIIFFEELAKRFGIHRVIVHDSTYGMDSLGTYRKLLELAGMLPCKLEYAGTNLLGLGTGNALGAVKSGVAAVCTSVGGVGNYPAFEEVIMSTNHLLKIPVPIPRDLALGCREILTELGCEILKSKPIVGSNIFAHESGIHVDGVIKRSELYEPFSPEEVGLSRKIVIGKHSGKAAIEQKIKELNIMIQPCSVTALLERVRKLAIRQKAAVMDEQLEQLAKEVMLYESAYC